MKVIDVALKDLTRSIRNLFLVGMAFIAPILITGLIYFAFGSMAGGNVDMIVINVGVVNADSLPENSPLNVALGDNIHDMFFDDSVKSWLKARDYPDEVSARSAIDQQEIGVAVFIPQSFTEDYLAGVSESPIVLLQDPTLTIAPNLVRDMVTSLLDGVAGGGIAFQVISERMVANGKTLNPSQINGIFENYATWYADFQRALFHTPETAALVVKTPAVNQESADTIQAMIGLVMAGQLIFFSFFTGTYSMMSILQEDEEGTLARLFTTPTRRSEILAGKFLAVFLTVLFQGIVLMAASSIAFGVKWGETTSTALGLLGQMFASVGLGVMLISFVKTSKQVGPIIGGGLTGLGMISGLFTTNINMPTAFNFLGNFTPQGWVLKAWRITLSGQPVREIVIPFLVLVAMGMVMFIIGVRVFRRRFA